MRRKVFKVSQRRMAVVGALLLAGSAVRAQDAVQAQIWAATARYVYADDPNLKALVPALNTELGQPQTLDEFSKGLQASVESAAGKSKSPNIRVLQRQFQKMRALSAADLVTVLPDSLSQMPVRNKGERQQRLNELKTELAGLASGAGPTPNSDGATALDAAGSPSTSASYPQVAATAAPSTSLWTWAALAMSGLSLLGVIRLLTRRRHSSRSADLGQSGHSATGSRELTFEQREEVRKMIERALAGRQSSPALVPASPPTAGKVPVAKAPSTKAPPANAPKPTPAPEPETIEISSTPLPALDSLIAESLAPAGPLVETDTKVVEFGTSIELDVTPNGPTSQLRRQFVNEAPFNNTFAARTLSDILTPYSIYEIQYSEQAPEQGRFRVVGNLGSHISNHRNILEPVCEYAASLQGGETRIVTEQPGEVRRRGEDWEVVRQAHIRFE